MVGVEIKRHERDMHMDNVWLAQTAIEMVCGHVWLVQRSRDMHVEMGGLVQRVERKTC